MASEERKVYQKEYHKNWYQQPENKKATRAKKDKWYADHPELAKESNRKASLKRVRRLRQQALMALGGTCVWCGCTDIRCLEIDHIEPVGRQRGQRVAFFLSIVQGNVEGLQILCSCCHSIKTYEERTVQD